MLYTIRSERLLVEQLDYNLLFRWFVGLGIDDPIWDHSTFSANRDRLLEQALLRQFFDRVLALADWAGLVSDEHFRVDGTMIEARASHKSLARKDQDDPPADSGSGGGRNAGVDFKGETFSNATHQSKTDPDARRYKKAKCAEAKLRHLNHKIELRLACYTCYAVERILEPDGFGHNQYGDNFHRNKWCAYRVGRHKPQHALVMAVDEQLPGTACLISHVIWDALQGKRSLSWLQQHGLPQLSSEVRQVICKPSRHGLGERALPQLGVREISRLERRASLDSLTALMIYLRMAAAAQNGMIALALGQAIYRTLMMLCVSLPFCSFSQELLLLFRRKLFPLANNGRIGMAIDCQEAFGNGAEFLHILLLQLEDAGIAGFTHKAGITSMRKLLDGDRGFHIKYALAPCMMAYPDATAEDHELLASWERLKRWGWDSLRNGGKEKLPPADVF